MFYFIFDEDNNKISEHTIKKFELISEYVKAWVQKLMNYNNCKGIVYIDCMSNSGVYHDSAGNEIEGTPIRVARIISDAMKQYSGKQAHLYFNDIEGNRVKILKSHLPDNTGNFHVHLSCCDGNLLIEELSKHMYDNYNYLLIYDPYQAEINWRAISPFFRTWSEVIINHMVSDSVRAVKVVKSPEKIEKYQNTYLTNIETLVSFDNDRDAFEKQIEKIIKELSGADNRKYYIASFPFFNKMNSVVYMLIHCTASKEGFKLYKTTAWKTFGDKSSSKNKHDESGQLVFKFEEEHEPIVTTLTDDYCYSVDDIVKYVQQKFGGRVDVPLIEIWDLLDEHPVFPSDGYKSEIKKRLKSDYDAKESKGKISFSDRRV